MEYIYGVHCGDSDCYACGTQRYNCNELNKLDDAEDNKRQMTKLEILDRIWNVLNQGVDTESGDLDLLRHDLENDVIAEQKFNQECG